MRDSLITPASTPITQDSSVCLSLSSLPQKFVVDFANGIDVVRDHARAQASRTGMFARMRDGFTGQGARRQQAINTSLADGVEGALQWLDELSGSVACCNFALVQVNERVSGLTRHVSALAHYSADTRQLLEQFAHQLSGRVDGLKQEIAHIGFIQQVQLNLDNAMNKWAGGRFAALSPAARAYVTLEELRWGALGDFCRLHGSQMKESREFIGSVQDQVTAQLVRDIHGQPDSLAAMRDVWLAAPVIRGENGDLQQAVAYLGDGFTPDERPFAFSAAQPERVLTVKKDDWPIKLSMTPNAKRVAEALVQEVLLEDVKND